MQSKDKRNTCLWYAERKWREPAGTVVDGEMAEVMTTVECWLYHGKGHCGRCTDWEMWAAGDRIVTVVIQAEPRFPF